MGLPDTIINAIKNDNYDNKNTYSATTLLNDPKQILLTRRHFDEIEEDASDRIWSLLGKSVHSILENAGEGEEEFTEERIFWKYGEDTVSGQFDLFDMGKKMLSDYKLTSVYTYILGDNKKYYLQLLIYAILLRKNGFECNSGNIYQIFRDWSMTKAKITAGYPQQPVNKITFNFKKEDFDYGEKFIEEKLAEINKYKDCKDDNIPTCSEETRWHKPDTFAVKKNGRKTALRVLSTKEDAEKYMKDNGGDFIEERSGTDTRCESYCPCREFCNYWKENYGK